MLYFDQFLRPSKCSQRAFSALKIGVPFTNYVIMICFPFSAKKFLLKLLNAFLYFNLIFSITVNLYVSISVHGYSNRFQFLLQLSSVLFRLSHFSIRFNKSILNILPRLTFVLRWLLSITIRTPPFWSTTTFRSLSTGLNF